MSKKLKYVSLQFSSIQWLSCVRLFATPWTAVCQSSLSITSAQSLLKLLCIEALIPSNHFFLHHPLLLPPSVFHRIRVFSNESVLHIRWPNCWSFSSASVLQMNIQDSFPLGWIGWISWLSKGLSSLFQHHSSKASILGTQPSL